MGLYLPTSLLGGTNTEQFRWEMASPKADLNWQGWNIRLRKVVDLIGVKFTLEVVFSIQLLVIDGNLAKSAIRGDVLSTDLLTYQTPVTRCRMSFVCKESDQAYLLGVPPHACFKEQVTPHLRLYTQN